MLIGILIYKDWIVICVLLIVLFVYAFLSNEILKERTIPTII
jgi:hypothetical protein